MNDLDVFRPAQSLKILGILNVTPDSFSDGGQYPTRETAAARCRQLIADGASLVDIGAESTRPGSDFVSEVVEWDRLEPVLEEIFAAGVSPERLSIDTRRDAIVLRCLEFGISNFNCVSGLYSDDVLRKVQLRGGSVMAMHMHDEPATMQLAPLDPGAAEVRVEAFLYECQDRLRRIGFGDDQYYLDPGIGFGKSLLANLRLVSLAGVWSRHFPLLYGISRKSFLGRLYGIDQPDARDVPSKVMEVGLYLAGVRMIRTHDVAGLNRSLTVLNKEIRS